MDKKELGEAYRQMAADEAREVEALAWAEAMIGDIAPTESEECSIWSPYDAFGAAAAMLKALKEAETR